MLRSIVELKERISGFFRVFVVSKGFGDLFRSHHVAFVIEARLHRVRLRPKVGLRDEVIVEVLNAFPGVEAIAHKEGDEGIPEFVEKCHSFGDERSYVQRFFRRELPDAHDVPSWDDHAVVLVRWSDVVRHERVRPLEDDAVLRVAERTGAFFCLHEVDVFNHGKHDSNFLCC